MSMTIALAGNPNSGKTTLFNALTGAKQHVGNWPGVTVEQKTGKYKKDKTIEVVDLPGIYSLSPYTQEEVVARNYIVDENPDVVIDIVDGTNIERNLYLTLQLLKTKVPVVIALNMMDEVEAQGTKVDVAKLEKELGVKVVPIIARSNKGINELMQIVQQIGQSKQAPKPLFVFDKELALAIQEIQDLGVNEWKATKLLEGDEIIMNSLSADLQKKVSDIIAKTDEKVGGDCEAAVADARYKAIGRIVSKAVSKKNGTKHVETISDKIDKIVTNRILAIPIFLAVMYLMFSITFGDSIISIGSMAQEVVEDFWDETLTETVVEFLEDAGAAEWAVSLVGEGILAGIGSVIAFLPQILLLFLLMSLLEDSGYMARVAFVMDRIFRKFGLSGKSFIPLLMGFGCSVPAVMAARTLENEKERKLTMMITPFMSCGAKMPIYLTFIAAIFADVSSTPIIFGIYLIGMLTAIITGIILSKTVFKGSTSNFIMELPQYRFPTVRSVLIHAWEKIKGFIIRAGTIILASTILIWFLANFNFSGFCEMEDSILASIGNGIKWIFAPLGFADWRATVGVITGWIAKENIVATFGVLFGAEDAIVEAAMEGQAALEGLSQVFTKVTAMSYMVFNLLCMPCFAAVGAIKREMASWKWTLKTIAFHMVTAYVVALLVNLIGNLIVSIF